MAIWEKNKRVAKRILIHSENYRCIQAHDKTEEHPKSLARKWGFWYILSYFFSRFSGQNPWFFFVRDMHNKVLCSHYQYVFDEGVGFNCWPAPPDYWGGPILILIQLHSPLKASKNWCSWDIWLDLYFCRAEEKDLQDNFSNLRN